MDVNERRRAFYQFDLDKVELVLCLVIEDLLGGRVCTGPVSQGELVGLTGLHRAQVCRGLASLLGRKQVLFEEAPPAPAGCYGFCSLRWNEHRRSDRVPGAQGVRLGLDDGTDLNVALARRSAGAGVVNSSTGVDESSTLSVDRVEDGNASLPMNRRVGVDESSTLRAIAIRAVQNQSDIAVRTALRVDDLRGLRERLLSLSGCGWSGDERKELLDLARMVGGGSFRDGKGRDYFPFWKNRIEGNADKALEALHLAVCERMEGRCHRSMLGYASGIVDDRRRNL
jgi:hypothetical protein